MRALVGVFYLNFKGRYADEEPLSRFRESLIFELKAEQP